PSSDLSIENVGLNPTRDQFLKTFERFAANITRLDQRDDCNEPSGKVFVRQQPKPSDARIASPAKGKPRARGLPFAGDAMRASEGFGCWRTKTLPLGSLQSSRWSKRVMFAANLSNVFKNWSRVGFNPTFSIDRSELG